ncbi:MAG: hypothetical protein AAB886_01910, partial [Patescibacteria group bacterium]
MVGGSIPSRGASTVFKPPAWFESGIERRSHTAPKCGGEPVVSPNEATGRVRGETDSLPGR